MIKRYGTIIVFVCDECGENLETRTYDFLEALKELKEEGWRSMKDLKGQWKHFCEECSDEMEE